MSEQVQIPAPKLQMIGIFKGVSPVEKINDNFSKRQLAIDTGEQIGNIKVFDLLKSDTKDNLNLCNGFQVGQLIRVSFNLRCVKTDAGKWFTSVVAWKVQPYVPQTTDEFGQPETNGAFNTTDTPPAQSVTTTTSTPPQSGDDLPF